MAEGVDVELQSLLSKAKPQAALHSECRGCKNSYLRDADARMPWKEMVILAMLALVNGALRSIALNPEFTCLSLQK